MEYKIKQIRNIENCPYVFASYDYAKNHGLSLNDYVVVYEDDIKLETSDKLMDYLEELFYIFNMEQPKDFKGHSLSVSDIVELDGKNYYCDNSGWKEME